MGTIAGWLKTLLSLALLVAVFQIAASLFGEAVTSALLALYVVVVVARPFATKLTSRPWPAMLDDLRRARSADLSGSVVLVLLGSFVAALFLWNAYHSIGVLLSELVERL